MVMYGFDFEHVLQIALKGSLLFVNVYYYTIVPHMVK